ncbi:unnamed protein product [Acanthosepion pharaonis]|uniref:Uncharacterized protein n=1 Tax=Acanthosepion pharaonis TaxID=158019 RepID=A0A812DDG2_ACAPH|nr:unnamed protein product [Sepia pharaonis]
MAAYSSFHFLLINFLYGFQLSISSTLFFKLVLSIHLSAWLRLLFLIIFPVVALLLFYLYFFSLLFILFLFPSFSSVFLLSLFNLIYLSQSIFTYSLSLFLTSSLPLLFWVLYLPSITPHPSILSPSISSPFRVSVLFPFMSSLFIFISIFSSISGIISHHSVTSPFSFFLTLYFFHSSRCILYLSFSLPYCHFSRNLSVSLLFLPLISHFFLIVPLSLYPHFSSHSLHNLLLLSVFFLSLSFSLHIYIFSLSFFVYFI